MQFKDLKAQLEAADQLQLLRFYDSLPDNEKQELVDNLSGLNYQFLNSIFKKAVSKTTGDVALSKLEKASVIGKDTKSWHDQGMKAIRENQVAVLLLAGGQGTRLGSSDPKGCFDIGLPSGKSLFQLQAERIVRLQKVHSV
jgi:UDP-N-acetylglucosamine/UDP-N-acetylgalactosamine diphosphorylase